MSCLSDSTKGPAAMVLSIMSMVANITVLDFGSQVHDAIIMNVYLDVRNPGGSGFWNGQGQGEGNEEFSLQAAGDQGGRILSQLGGFQVSKGD